MSDRLEDAQNEELEEARKRWRGMLLNVMDEIPEGHELIRDPDRPGKYAVQGPNGVLPSVI